MMKKNILILSLLLSFCDSLFAQKTVFTPTEWSNPAHEFYNRMSPDRMYQSANFVIYWGDLVGTNPQTASDVNLRFNPQAVADTFEFIFKRYITDLNFINNAPTTNFGRYKTPVIILNTFSGGDARTTGFAHASSYSNTIGAMFVHPTAVRDGGAISHEYAHALQMMMRIQENPGAGNAYAGYDWAGPFFEGHANFMRAQVYQKWANVDGTLTRWIQTRHLMWSSNRHHYTNYNVLFYVQEKEGFDFTRRMWAESRNQEHPFETIKRLKGFTQEQLNDYLWEYAAKDVTFDYPIQWNSQINNTNNFGKVIRDTYKQIRATLPRYTSREYTLLDKVTGTADQYFVNSDWAPSDYGMNIIPLYPTCSGTDKIVTIKFKGHTEVNTTHAGWRYGFVTTKSDGTVSRYSPMYSAADGEASFNLNTATESNIYFVVFSAPKVHSNYNMDVGYPKMRRYPYELKIANAVPEGYQAAGEFRKWRKTNGTLHPNGGGWVANGASVASTVYVGPYAMVLRGTVSGNVRVEGFATIDGGNVSGNAIVRGNAYLYNATVSGDAIIEGNAWFEGGSATNSANVKGNAMVWGASYANSVVVGGDAEIGSCSTNGVYLQPPYWRNGRTDCDGKGITDVSNVDINASFTNFSSTQMAFTNTPNCSTTNTLPSVTIINPTSNNSICTGVNTIITVNASDSDGSISKVEFYKGTTLLGQSVNTNSPYSYTITNPTAGSYTIVVKATDNAGGVTTITGPTITVNSVPSAPTVANISYCQNAIATALTATGTALKWYANNTTTTSSTTAPTPSTSTVGSTSFFVSQTTNGCESPRAQISVTVNALPTATITAGSSTTFCSGGSVTFTSSTGTSYQWNNTSGAIAGATTATYSATASGSYSVRITNANNCSATSNATTVTVNSVPSAPTVANISYCQNAIATALTATGTALKWYANNTTTTSSTTAPTPSTSTVGSTSFFVSQTTNGCESPRAQISVTVNALPTISPFIQVNAGGWNASNTAVVCSGGTVTIGPQPNASTGWNWTGPNNYTSSTRQINLTNLTTGGTYTATYNNGTCSNTQSFTITVNPNPSTPTIIGNTSFCLGGSTILSTTAAGTLQWKQGTTNLGTTSNQTVTTAGSYTVEVTNTNGCKATSAAITVVTNTPTNWYADTDNDGFGDPNSMIFSCSTPQGYVNNNIDQCPNNNQKTSPGQCGCSASSEADTDGDNIADCVDTDDDNDGIADTDDCAPLNNSIGLAITWYEDADNDGYGDASSSIIACIQPTGYVLDNTDECPDMNLYHTTPCATTTSTNNAYDLNNWKVFPNPMSSTCVIQKIGATAEVSIYNALGVLILSEKVISELEIGNNLPAGIYEVMINENQTIAVVKIVKY